MMSRFPPSPSSLTVSASYLCIGRRIGEGKWGRGRGGEEYSEVTQTSIPSTSTCSVAVAVAAQSPASGKIGNRDS